MHFYEQVILWLQHLLTVTVFYLINCLSASARNTPTSAMAIHVIFSHNNHPTFTVQYNFTKIHEFYINYLELEFHQISQFYKIYLFVHCTNKKDISTYKKYISHVFKSYALNVRMFNSIENFCDKFKTSIYLENPDFV